LMAFCSISGTGVYGYTPTVTKKVVSVFVRFFLRRFGC
jgi:hypothetical protein